MTVGGQIFFLIFAAIMTSSSIFAIFFSTKNYKSKQRDCAKAAHKVIYILTTMLAGLVIIASVGFAIFILKVSHL